MNVREWSQLVNKKYAPRSSCYLQRNIFKRISFFVRSPMRKHLVFSLASIEMRYKFKAMKYKRICSIVSTVIVYRCRFNVDTRIDLHECSHISPAWVLIMRLNIGQPDLFKVNVSAIIESFRCVYRIALLCLYARTILNSPKLLKKIELHHQSDLAYPCSYSSRYDSSPFCFSIRLSIHSCTLIGRIVRPLSAYLQSLKPFLRTLFRAITASIESSRANTRASLIAVVHRERDIIDKSSMLSYTKPWSYISRRNYRWKRGRQAYEENSLTR